MYIASMVNSVIRCLLRHLGVKNTVFDLSIRIMAGFSLVQRGKNLKIPGT